jgi:hypothetical protein
MYSTVHGDKKRCLVGYFHFSEDKEKEIIIFAQILIMTQI